MVDSRIKVWVKAPAAFHMKPAPAGNQKPIEIVQNSSELETSPGCAITYSETYTDWNRSRICRRLFQQLLFLLKFMSVYLWIRHGRYHTWYLERDGFQGVSLPKISSIKSRVQVLAVSHMKTAPADGQNPIETIFKPFKYTKKIPRLLYIQHNIQHNIQLNICFIQRCVIQCILHNAYIVYNIFLDIRLFCGLAPSSWKWSLLRRFTHQNGSCVSNFTAESIKAT